MKLFGVDFGGTNSKGLNLNNIFFISPDHVRYEGGRHTSGPHGGAKRGIKIEKSITGVPNAFTVTILNLDGDTPVTQMSPKSMSVVSNDKDCVQLRGLKGNSVFNDFSDYGISIFHTDGEIEKVKLHMFDRDVVIEYLSKVEDSISDTEEEYENFETRKLRFAQWGMNFIYGNNMEFGRDELFELLSHICLLEHLIIRDYNSDEKIVILKTDKMVEQYFTISREIHGSWIDHRISELKKRVYNWSSKSHEKQRVIAFCNKYFGDDYSGLINDYFK